MNEREALSLVVQLSTRAFGMLLMLCYALLPNNDGVLECLDAQREWYERTADEYEVQRMIDDLYN